MHSGGVVDDRPSHQHRAAATLRGRAGEGSSCLCLDSLPSRETDTSKKFKENKKQISSCRNQVASMSAISASLRVASPATARSQTKPVRRTAGSSLRPLAAARPCRALPGKSGGDKSVSVEERSTSGDKIGLGAFATSAAWLLSETAALADDVSLLPKEIRSDGYWLEALHNS